MCVPPKPSDTNRYAAHPLLASQAD